MKRDFINNMQHSPVKNYGGIPGLTSWLIGEPTNKGVVRLLECSRNHQEPIIPHSHRFDFQCFVLSGEVRNVIWSRTRSNFIGDQFQETQLVYKGEMGKYELGISEVHNYEGVSRIYTEGEQYSMSAHEIHSIYFKKDTSVLFLEGPTIATDSVILQPYIDGEVVPTFEVRPWMFKKGG